MLLFYTYRFLNLFNIYIDHIYNTMSACERLINAQFRGSYHKLQPMSMYFVSNSYPLFPIMKGVQALQKAKAPN